jgi:hypothetical protein
MSLVLRVKRRVKKGVPNTATIIIELAPDMYTLETAIQQLDDCMYDNAPSDFLTAKSEVFHFDPAFYSAISIVEKP